MRKASQILMRIGAAFAIVTVVSTIISAAILYASGVSAGLIMYIVGIINSTSESSDPAVFFVMGTCYMIAFAITAISIVCSAVFPLVSGILGFIGGRKKAGKKIFVANIIFAILLAYNFSSGFGLVAAVLLLVGSFMGLSAVKEEKAALAEQPVEEQK